MLAAAYHSIDQFDGCRRITIDRGIDCLPPFVVHGTHTMPPREIEEHGASYRRVLEAIRDGRIDAGDPGVVELNRLNTNLDVLLAGTEEGESDVR